MRQIEDELKTEPMFKRFVATMTNVIDQVGCVVLT